MRRGEDRLEKLLGPFACQGVEHKRDDDRERESNHKAQNAQQESVFHQRPELNISEKAGEIAEADPDRSVRENFVPRHEVLKRDQHTVNWQIVK